MNRSINGLSDTKLTGLVCVLLGIFNFAEVSADPASSSDLLVGFKNPPSEAKPRVWWHWMNGNISEEGIVKDLEWMHRVGIGGVQNFDAAMETPIIVDQRLSFMSPAWKKAFATAVKKAEELDLEFAIASSAGWSLTGGPWVPAEDAMKKLVWSETMLDGGAAVSVKLPQPSATVGPFQTLKAAYKHGHNPDAIPEQFYRDVMVLAYPAAIHPEPSSAPVINVNEVPIDSGPLLDGDLVTGIDLPGSYNSGPGVIEFHYPSPQTIRSAVIYIENLPSGVMQGALKPRLEAEVDGAWQPIAEIGMGAVPSTVSFPAVTAKQFRLLFTRDKPGDFFRFAPAPGIDPSGMMGLGVGGAGKPGVTDLRLFADARVHRFEVKAGFALVDDYHGLGGDTEAALKGVAPESVVDITRHQSADGVLSWEPPPGQWKVVRLGYSLTGKTNSPATDEATGLEVDKYDSAAVERYLNRYLGMYRDVVGEKLVGEKGLSALLTDSIEAGPSNWTPGLVEHFRRLRGYDPIPWLPTLTGNIVGTRQQSDGFLYDFRRTLAELNASEHYGTVAEVAHRQNLRVYGESLEGNRLVSTLGDDLEMRRFADIPMAAMWSFGEGGEPAPHYVADMRGAASVAHIYGKPYVAAESLTSILAPWAHGPAELQPMIDAEFLNGINRPVIHTSPHQPVDDKVPGLSLHVFGQYFTRHDTWAEMAKPWVDYLSRNSFLLQQGSHVADVAYFYGEEPPVGVLAGIQGLPEDLPVGYGYDFLPPHALLNELTVHENEIVSSGGARYQVLFLGQNARAYMTLPVLKKLAGLVQQGANLVGLPPLASPSLADSTEEFATLVATMWGGETVTRMGEGKVIAVARVEQALGDLGITEDFIADVSGDEGGVQFIHRQLEDGDIYFVANRGDEREVTARFRVTGKVPEIWRADSGSIEPVSYEISDGSTQVAFEMNARESYFVVFRGAARQSKLDIDKPEWQPLVEIESPWQVSFQPGRGAPDKATFENLQSLSLHPEPGIKYFSGVSTYRNTFTLDEVAAGDVVLDLGKVGDVAEVYVNGESAGTAWRSPYRVDISKQLRSGENRLEIRVANLWVNRLIGDRQADAQRITYTTFNTYLPKAPLRTAGLLGPVRVLTAGEMSQ